MEKMTLEDLVRQRGDELPGCLLAKVDVVVGYVMNVPEVFILDVVSLTYGTYVDTQVTFMASHPGDEAEAMLRFELEGDDADPEGLHENDLDMTIPAAVYVAVSPDGTVWLNAEEG